MTITGQCLCGRVRFTIDAEPLGARMCWCRDCQRIASGSATVNVLFPEEAVHYQGDIATFEMDADSGNRVRRGFCLKCGAQMYSATLEPAGAPIRVRAGTLDDPDLVAPQAVIWTSSAPGWAVLDPSLPHHPKGPDTEPDRSRQKHILRHAMNWLSSDEGSWLGLRRDVWLSILLTAAGIIVITAFLITAPHLTGVKVCKIKWDLATYFMVILWVVATLIPPLYFICEWASFSDKVESENFKKMKYSHEVCSKFWLASITVISVIIFFNLKIKI